MIKWANAELDIVKENYPKFRYISEFMHLLPNRTIRGVEDRVKIEGIKRSDAIKLQIHKELSERLIKHQQEEI